MKLALKDSSTEIELSDAVFGVEYKQSLVHQAVVSHMAGERSGTKAQKNRAAVSGGGAKPWRQKGTGRARAGTSRGPIWRKGGVTFAAAPRDHSKKLNKKMYRGAIRSILSELIREGALSFIEEVAISAPKTKEAISFLKPFEAEQSALLIVDAPNEAAALAVRNLYNVELVTVENVNPYSLIKANKVLCTSAAAKKIEEWLQ